MEMTLMRRDLPGSFRFGTLASIARALSGLAAGVSSVTPVPQASSANGGTASAPRLAIPAAAWQRARMGVSAGNWAGVGDGSLAIFPWGVMTSSLVLLPPPPSQGPWPPADALLHLGRRVES